MTKVCISIEENTKNKLKSMGSKGDTYGDVIEGLLGLSQILSNKELAASLAKDSGMSPEFVKGMKSFSDKLVQRGKLYRNFDYDAQRLMVRLDLLS